MNESALAGQLGFPDGKLVAAAGTGDTDREVCLHDELRSYTRHEVRQAIAGQAAALVSAGVRNGHRVLLLLDHDSSGVFLLAAASLLGVRLLMPYNLQAAAVEEWRTIVMTARPDFIVYVKRDERALAGLRDLAVPVLRMDRSAGPPTRPWTVKTATVEDFLVLFTSGTTGSPKAISVSERVVCDRVARVSQRLGFGPDARVFMSGLLNNTTGLIFSFGALLHGATLIMPGGRNVATWPTQVAASGATHIMLRPVAMKRFVEAAAEQRTDLTCLRVVAYGAAAMPRAVLEQGRRLMPGRWIQGYGLSETFGPFCWLDETEHREQRYRHHTYCVGRPEPGAQIRIVPLPGQPGGIGEVLVRTDAVMNGYLDVATGRLSPPGDWLCTGDLGTFSPDGDLLLKGRLHDSVLSRNGHRIYPEELEAIFTDLPGVDDAVLIGLPDPAGFQEQPVLCLSGPLARNGPETVRETVRQTLVRQLSPEKWPDALYLQELPFAKSANDKVLRPEVAQRAARGRLLPL